MADAITIKALQDASLDAKSLSEFIFKPANFMVIRRLAPPTNTLQYYIDLFENISIGGEFNSAKIESLTVTTSAAGTNASVVTGGTPSNRTFALTIPRGDTGAKGADGKDGSFTQKAYSTEALMIADKASIPANTSVTVTNDTTPSKNGMYAYNGTAFTKSAYDPLLLARRLELQGSTLVDAEIETRIYIENNDKNTLTDYSIYLKISGNFYIGKQNVAASHKVSWEQLKTQVARPDLFVTSPLGVTDCLKLSSNALVFNNVTNLCEVVQRHLVLDGVHTVIARELYGKIQDDGIYTTWMRQSQEDYVFYVDEGYADSGVVLDVSTSADLYPEQFEARVKITKPARLRSPIGTIVFEWSKVISDINDPSIVVTGRNGEPDYIKLKDSCLVYDTFTGKFKITPTAFHNISTDILLASSIYGQITGGLLLDWCVSKEVMPMKKSALSGKSSPNTRFIAHGGMNGFMQFAPLNTAPAYRNAGEYGYWGAETDIVETKDGEWIHCHDQFLSDYIVGGTGNFKDYTLAQIKAMDATKMSASYGWTDVPPLELSEFLDICKQYGMTPVIEFKSIPTAAGVNKVLSLINSSVGQKNCVLMSFNLAVLQLVRSINAKVPLFLLTFAMTQTNTSQALALGNCGLSVQSTSTAANIKLAREAGVEVGIWTVSQSQIDSDLVKGVDYVTTDIGVPYDFKKGVATYNFKNSADFSNLTSKGTATATNNKLAIPASSNVYLDIPVSYGDVITVSCEAKASDGGSTITIRGLNSSLATVRDYTARAIKVGNFAVHTAASVVYDKSVTSVRVLISSGSTASSIRDIKIKKYEV